MFKSKVNILITGLIIIFILSECVSAQGLDISGNATFLYSTSASSTKANTVQDLDEQITQSYALNVKNDIASDGSSRTAVKYSINNNVKAKKETTDLNVSLSYDKIACTLGLTDDTNSEFDVGVTNLKSNSFSFSINPDVLPRFSFNYSNSIANSELTTTSDNTLSVQFSKNFTIQDSNISSAISYSDNNTNSEDNPTVKQTTDNKFNLGYNTKLLDGKLSLSSGYRVGNSYDVSTSINNLTESGDASFGFSLLENLIINGDWGKSNTLNSNDGKMNVTNNNGFRIAFTPIKNLSFASSVKFTENQSESSLESNSTRDFTVRVPPLFNSVNIGYTYSSSETKNTVIANDSIDLTFNPGSLSASNFTSSARYGFGKKHSIDNTNASEIENFGLTLTGKIIEDLDCSYSYVLDKNNSNIQDDNKDTISNSINLAYSIQLIEDLVSSINTSYGHTQNISSTVSSDKTESAYNVNLGYKLGQTSISVTGGFTRSFDETGTHLSQRTDFGPTIATIIQGVPLSAKLSVGTDSKDAELASTNNINYSVSTNYPIGTIGTSSLTYTATKQENLSDPSSNSNTENISVNLSFTF